MKAITIQQEARADLSSPWPISIGENGQVAHPEKYLGEPKTLIGFQQGTTPVVTLFANDWVNQPRAAVGLTPVFSNADGAMFALNGAVSDITEHAATFEQIAS